MFVSQVRLISEFRQEKRRGEKLKAMFAPPVANPKPPKKKQRRRFVSTRVDGNKVTRVETVAVNPGVELLKQSLARKLSSRLSVSQMRDRKVLTRFSDYNEVDTAALYNRKLSARHMPWAKLTPKAKLKVRAGGRALTAHPRLFLCDRLFALLRAQSGLW